MVPSTYWAFEQAVLFSYICFNNQISKIMKKKAIAAVTIAIFSLFLIFTSGCKKNLPITDPNPVPENPLELTVSNSFDWKTTREIGLEVTGITIPANIKNTLQVKSTDEVKVFLKNQIFMNQDYSLKFTIPAYETEVLITYGSIRQTLDVTTDVIYFSYLSE